MAPRYSTTPGRFAADKRAQGSHMRVLLLLGRHTDNEGWCVRSQVRMAGELGLSRETVNRAIADLVAWGYVQKTSQDTTRRSVCFYRVMLDSPHPPQMPPEDDLDDETEAEDDGSGSVDNVAFSDQVAEGECDLQLTGGVTSEITGGVTYEITHNVPCSTSPVKRQRRRAGEKGARSTAPGSSTQPPKFADVFNGAKVLIAAADHPKQWAAWCRWADQHATRDQFARTLRKMVFELSVRSAFVPSAWPPGSNATAVGGSANA